MCECEIKQLRQQLFDLIQPIWTSKMGTREEVYSWLAHELQLPNFAVSKLSSQQIAQALDIVRKYSDANQKRIKHYGGKQREKRNRLKRH